MFNITTDMEIAITTFNRKPFLQKTLDKLLGADSPVQSCQIYVYNNHSTDGTAELLNEYAAKYPNLHPVHNRRNVGLSANICKAMENASKKYLWILCDNDEIDWTAWPSVLKGLKEEHDIVMASRFYIADAKTANTGLKIAQLTFLPSGIYKMEHLTDFVMSWMYNDTFTVLPHIVLACAIINNNGSIYISDGSVITLLTNPEERNSGKATEESPVFDRISTKCHPKANIWAFEACEVNACSLLDNPQHRREFIKAFSNKHNLNGYGPYFKIHRAIKRYFQHRNTFSNLMDIYPALSCTEKLKFWIYFLYAAVVHPK